MQPGVILAHKEVGATSFEVVKTFIAEAAAEPGARKFPLCHAGALDPFAHGLLLILAGQGTRLMELLHPLPKSYLAEVVWGRETDNGDLLGRTVFEGDASTLEPTRLDAALLPHLGWRDQIPPATSNKWVDGERAYARAHRGEKVELPPSRVYLHSARWLSHALDGPRKVSQLAMTCKGGYYVRSLGRELGAALGCGAHLGSLQRTAIGPWEDPGKGRRVRVDGERLLTWCRTRRLGDAEAAGLAKGQPIGLGALEAPAWQLPAGYPDPEGPVRAVHQGRLVALLREKDGMLVTFANLRGGL